MHAALILALLIQMLSVGSLMMVLPLAADLALALDMAVEHIGYLGGGATLGSALVGLLAAPWLDRLPRKPALIGLLALRFTLLLGCALADSGTQLACCFILAGCLAGPLAAVLTAALLDLIPLAERGRRLAFVAMGFSLSAILVVPLALELAARSGWSAPFIALGAGGLLLVLASALVFPDAPRPRPLPDSAAVSQPGEPLCRLALLIVALQMFGHFLLIPQLAGFLQFNLHFPRAELGLLYLGGGLASMATMHLGGYCIDRGRAMPAMVLTSLPLALLTLAGWGLWPGQTPIYPLFIAFMALSSVRSSMTHAITAGVPAANRRAAYLSVQGAVTNIAAGMAAIGSAHYLSTDPAGRLRGVAELAALNGLCILLAAIGTLVLLRRLAQRRPAPTGSPPLPAATGR